MKELGIIITPYIDKEIVHMAQYRSKGCTRSWAYRRRRSLRLRKRSSRTCPDDLQTQSNITIAHKAQSNITYKPLSLVGIHTLLIGVVGVYYNYKKWIII